MPLLRSRSGIARLGAIASFVTAAGAALFALLEEGVAAGMVVGEPLLVGAAVACVGYGFLKLAGWVIETRDLARETHSGLFNPHTGVFTILDQHEKRADRHSGEIRAMRDGAD